MGRHQSPESRPTAPVPAARRQTPQEAPAGRPRRRIGWQLATLAIGSALTVGCIPGAVSTESVDEARHGSEASTASVWAQQQSRGNAQQVSRAHRAARGPVATGPTAPAPTPTEPATTTTGPTPPAPTSTEPATTTAGPAMSTGPTPPAPTSTAPSTTSTAPAPPAPTSTAPSTTTTTPGTVTTATSGGMLAAGTGAVGGVLATAAELTGLPVSGTPWNNLLSAANKRSTTVDLANQDSTHAAETLASALVFARTGDAAQRNHVVAVLQKLPSSSLSGARVLSVGRQLGGYVMAADLVGYRDPAFVSYVAGMRTKDIGNHGRWTTITGTSEDSANNWGTWAMSTRIAISSYVGDEADLARAATVFRGYTGDSHAYAGFRESNEFDPTWACGGDAWVPINPASCGDRAGAIVEDISRSGGSYPTIDGTGIMYSWEVLGGLTMSARILERAGYSDVWQWGDRALLRAATFLLDHGGYQPPYRVNQHIPHEINNAYDVKLGPVGAAGHGRQSGFSDWLVG